MRMHRGLSSCLLVVDLFQFEWPGLSDRHFWREHLCCLWCTVELGADEGARHRVGVLSKHSVGCEGRSGTFLGVLPLAEQR